MIKKTILAAAVLAASALVPAQAELLFNFDYSQNAAGVGFLDTTQGEARRNALETAGTQFSSLFGNYFSNSATIVMAVTSSDDANSGTLASAGTNVVSACGTGLSCVTNEVVRNKLQGGVDANGMAADGNVDVNWGNAWELNPNTDPDASIPEYDFFATLYHEFTHALGFFSSLSQTGKGFFGTEWSTFDIFLQNANGESIIDDMFALNQARWDESSVGGTGNGIFFGGANAVAANNGNLVGIYSPTTWEDGSSGSHVDGIPFPTDMMKFDGGPGPEPFGRLYSAVNIGILTDLGYTRNAINNVASPGMFGLAMMGLIFTGFVSRRKA